jgi:hypothetical protein
MAPAADGPGLIASARDHRLFVLCRTGGKEEEVSTKATRRTSRRAAEPDLGFNWGMANSLLLGLGLAVLVVGYFALSRGSITLAPVLLVLGYVVLIPASLLLRRRVQGSGE